MFLLIFKEEGRTGGGEGRGRYESSGKEKYFCPWQKLPHNFKCFLCYTNSQIKNVIRLPCLPGFSLSRAFLENVNRQEGAGGRGGGGGRGMKESINNEENVLPLAKASVRMFHCCDIPKINNIIRGRGSGRGGGGKRAWGGKRTT